MAYFKAISKVAIIKVFISIVVLYLKLSIIFVWQARAYPWGVTYYTPIYLLRQNILSLAENCCQWSNHSSLISRALCHKTCYVRNKLECFSWWVFPAWFGLQKYLKQFATKKFYEIYSWGLYHKTYYSLDL